jgi:hypothetical protein
MFFKGSKTKAFSGELLLTKYSYNRDVKVGQKAN